MKKLCKGKSRQTGEPCKLPPSPGRDYCRHHGGHNLRGSAHPNYKHGRNVKGVLPPKLRERFEASQADPDLLALRQDIGIVDAMLEERLETLTDGGASAVWPKARKALQEFRGAMASGNIQAMRLGLDALGDLIDEGSTEAEAREEVLRLIQDRRKLVESEQRRVTAMRNIVTGDQIVILMDRIGLILSEEVPSARSRVRIADRLEEIMMIPEGGD